MEFLKLKSSLEACFLLRAVLNFYDAYLRFNIVSNEWEQKHRAPNTCYVSNEYAILKSL